MEAGIAARFFLKIKDTIYCTTINKAYYWTRLDLQTYFINKK